MNTLGYQVPRLRSKNARDNIIALDGLEFAFPIDQLEKIKNMHNTGYHFNQISQAVKRNPYEVIIALLHLAREGHYLLPIGGYKHDKHNAKSAN